MGVTVYPTGTCFEDTTLMASSLWCENEFNFLVVHGICLLPDGKPYAHAWIEKDQQAWFVGVVEGERVKIKIPLDQFYQHFQVQEQTKYDLTNLIETALKNNDAPPPWEEKYRRLCLNGGTQ